MPQPFNSAVLTDRGAALLTRAQAGETRMRFTRVVVGNGEYTDDEKALAAMQARQGLKSEKNSYRLSSITVNNEYSVKVTALISNSNVETGENLVPVGYYINEIGLVACGVTEDGGGNEVEEPEILYSIAITAGDRGDYMPPYNGFNPAQILQEYYATVSNASEVTITTVGAAMLREDFDKFMESSMPGAFKSSTGYKAGEYVTYNGVIYRALADIDGGEWDASQWVEANIYSDTQTGGHYSVYEPISIDNLSSLEGAEILIKTPDGMKKIDAGQLAAGVEMLITGNVYANLIGADGSAFADSDGNTYTAVKKIQFK